MVVSAVCECVLTMLVGCRQQAQRNWQLLDQLKRHLNVLPTNSARHEAPKSHKIPTRNLENGQGA